MKLHTNMVEIKIGYIVSIIDNFSYEVMNQTSIGNLLFIYDYAYIEDRKKIEKFFNRLLRDK